MKLYEYDPDDFSNEYLEEFSDLPLDDADTAADADDGDADDAVSDDDIDPLHDDDDLLKE
jgi:hypothetical protein